MGTEERKPDAHLTLDAAKPEETLAAFSKNARRFNYFRLLYLLERLYPDSARIGMTGPARSERVRLRSESSLVFASSDVSSLEQRKFPDGESRAEITAAFLGLYGSASPLPPYYVERIALSVHQGGTQPVRELLDVIHHRVFSLVYRSWAKYRHSVGYTRRGQDRFTQRMFCAVGVDGFGARDMPLDPFYFLRFAPLLASKSRSARGLQVVLDQLLSGIRVDIEQFVGAWTLIEKPLRNKLGLANHQLGESLVIGRYVFDGSGRYKIALGPLDYDDYLSFLPGGHQRPFLQSVVGTFTPGIHDVMLELHVDLEATPKFQLGSPRSSTLARTAWLGGGKGQQFSITVPLGDGPQAETGEDDDRGEPPPLPQ
ncbi:MAG: type VI secretion system baseplate subunit TssG [Deltaproteobacteria bacterium]|nr:type VI secretion system baseplate subunit TssG [Deltaproteobacteria bacterium]